MEVSHKGTEAQRGKFQCLLLISSVLLLNGCVKAEDIDPHGIKQALLDLATRRNEDAYVIVEALPSERYVQFSNYNDGIVYFNFPILSVEIVPFDGVVRTEYINRLPELNEALVDRLLSIEEEERLIKYLKNQGIDYEVVYFSGEFPEGRVVSYFKDIEGDLAITPAKYSEFIIGVFEEVYLLSDITEIRISEN